MSSRSASPAPPGPPGSISMFFVAKAALFGAVAWAWLVYLIARGSDSGWLVFAASAGICFTIVTVSLGIRFASQRAAALRHAELVKEVSALSWQLTAMVESGEAPPARVFTMPTGPDRSRR